jgi:triosephosphate isomerase
MIRKPFIAGNWKMHNGIAESLELASAIKNAPNNNEADICLAPSFTALHATAQILKDSHIILSAQDCHFEDKGAFTSAVSPIQVKNAGAACVIIGHSERRSLFGDSNNILNKKVRAALKHGLKIIFCIGETIEEREAGRTAEVIKTQIFEGLCDFSAEDLNDLIVAYEPVWAIGTGKTATPQQAQQTHQEIRKLINNRFGADFAQNIRILYGGSVKTDNVDAIMAQEDVDGVLVGGQSLEADKFIRIINYNKYKNQ